MTAFAGMVLTGCSADGPATPDSPSATPSEGAKTGASEQQARVTVRVSGAENYRWEGRQLLRFLREGALGESVNLLSVGAVLPQALDDPRDRFRWAFDLINQYADKPGSYTLERDTGTSEVSSNILLISMRVKDGSKSAVFDWADVERFVEYTELQEPCVVEVGPEATSGTLSCPAVADAKSGQVVAIEAEWEW